MRVFIYLDAPMSPSCTHKHTHTHTHTYTHAWIHAYTYTHSGKPDAPYVSFVGSHLDVVPANPDDWDFDPFQLHVDGDMLKGRGVTDCLGHVALLTELFRNIAIKKPVYKVWQVKSRMTIALKKSIYTVQCVQELDCLSRPRCAAHRVSPQHPHGKMSLQSKP
jgi:hypothetical protein